MASEPPEPRIVTARDGTRLRLRPIRPADWQGVRQGFESWSAEQKRQRMLGAIEHLSDTAAQRFATLRDPAHEICLVLAAEDDDSDLLGGARLVGAPGRDDGEFAVSIRGDAQGRGLGRLALEAVLAEGPARGITRAWGLIGRRNEGMLALARRLGFALRAFPDDMALLLAEKDLGPG
ncbi:hypothetical protein LNKW23_14640 [Paralimibaculum aggregatum]|uniref:N-acetyltransferase domain-containing protein n=1 Tax=Paralimibaculum aggregatum TaxID=3036245 RepID=A0ABQ6LP89_9RHOB|nr:GNAT family N-acetyltransferase [Limibaculum sp. NKW23]GMG82251.1 hypothetical protein LNKW23_14640 [Limibaculum sp. NKW23]